MNSRTFISYARKDSAFVLRLASDLKAKGADVWLDQLDIRPGLPWDAEVERALKACGELLAILSPASVESQNVMDEVAFALDEGKTIIPALHSDCQIPLRLRRLEYVDLRSDYVAGLEKLLDALAPGRQPAASGASEPSKGRARAIGRKPLAAGAVALAIVAAAAFYRYYPHPPTAPRAVDTAKAEEPARSSATARLGDTRVNAKDSLTYVWIAPGKFTMGCSPGEVDCGAEERPAHEVTLTKGFWIGQTEVTQEAYERLIGSDPSHFKGAKMPAAYVDWQEADAFCRSAGGRLPTEAEWEYAARARNDRSRRSNLGQIAWFKGNSGGKAHEVGLKSQNEWKLFDMLGNVWEWVADWYGEYPSGAATDPRGPANGPGKVQRGGGWNSNADYATVSRRGAAGEFGVSDDTGFRCALDSSAL